MSAVCGCRQMFANRRIDELEIAFTKAIRCTQVILSSAWHEFGSKSIQREVIQGFKCCIIAEFLSSRLVVIGWGVI